MPASPHSAAGPRIEPPVSDPVPPRIIPDATAAPVPDDEPEVKCAGVPRIARRRPRQVEARAAHGEFVRRQLAQHHRARVCPFAHDGRHRCPARCVPAVWNARSCGCRRYCRCPCARSGCRPACHATARHDPRFRRASVSHGALLRHQQEGVQRGVERLDPVEARLRQFDGRDLLAGDLPRCFGDGEEMVHQRTSGMKICDGSASRGIGLVTTATMASTNA